MDDILIAIQAVAKGLGPLLPEVIFVGGAVTLFYVDSDYAEEPRPTVDIDCIIEIAGKVRYAELEEKLRGLGFINDREVICRWLYNQIVVDVMPTDEKILGFSNRWYKDGLSNPILVNLPNGTEIKLLSLDYFICAKLEAHASRGASDPRQSKDLEDIFYLLDGVSNFQDKIKLGSKEPRAYIAKSFNELSSRTDYEEILAALIPFGPPGRGDNIRALIESKEYL